MYWFPVTWGVVVVVAVAGFLVRRAILNSHAAWSEGRPALFVAMLGKVVAFFGGVIAVWAAIPMC